MRIPPISLCAADRLKDPNLCPRGFLLIPEPAERTQLLQTTLDMTTIMKRERDGRIELEKIERVAEGQLILCKSLAGSVCVCVCGSVIVHGLEGIR